MAEGVVKALEVESLDQDSSRDVDEVNSASFIQTLDESDGIRATPGVSQGRGHMPRPPHSVTKTNVNSVTKDSDVGLLEAELAALQVEEKKLRLRNEIDATRQRIRSIQLSPSNVYSATVPPTLTSSSASAPLPATRPQPQVATNSPTNNGNDLQPTPTTDSEYLLKTFIQNLSQVEQKDKKSKALKIVDFIWEEPSVKDNHDTLTIEAGAVKLNRKTKPDLQNLSVEQWGYGAVAILLHMLNQKEIDMVGVQQYLKYLQTTFRFFHRFTRPSVLLYDKEFREAQKQEVFAWNSSRRDIQDVQLVSKPIKTSSEAPTASKRRRGPFLPSGKEICRRFNMDTCEFKSCRLAHSCSLCFGDHPAVKHPTKN